jgi:hypothetical protein
MNSKSLNIRLVMAIFVAVIAAIIPAILLIASLKYSNQISDLPEYYAAAKLFLEGNGAHIYDPKAFQEYRHLLFPDLRERGLSILSPPFAIVYLVPLLLIPLSSLYITWLSVSLTATLAGIFFLKRFFQLNLIAVFWLCGATALFGPWYEAVRIGQITPFLFLAFASAICALKKERYLIAALALSTFVLKPHEILPFIVYLIGAKRYRIVFILAIVIVISILISLTATGINGYTNYLNVFANLSHSDIWMLPEITPTIRGQLIRLHLLPEATISIISQIISIATLAFSYYFGRKMSSSNHWLNAGIIGIIPLTLVSAFLCHYYDLLLLLPSIVAIVQLAFQKKLPEWLLLLILPLYITLSIPVYVTIHYQYLLPGILSINPSFIVLLIYTIICLVISWNYKAAELNASQ